MKKGITKTKKLPIKKHFKTKETSDQKNTIKAKKLLIKKALKKQRNLQ
jgi:hypothetical protein